MAIKAPRILFFIDGPVPTAANKIEANAMRGNGAIVCFRNSRFVGGDGNDGAPEPNDGVAGKVPTDYEGQPTADVAIKKYVAALDEEARAFAAHLQTAPAAPVAPAAPAAPQAPAPPPAPPAAPGAPTFGAPPAPPAPQQ